MNKSQYKETIASMLEIIENHSNEITDLNRYNSNLHLVINDLEEDLQYKNMILDHFRISLKSCESACIYHQERADKAEQVIEDILKLAGGE